MNFYSAKRWTVRKCFFALFNKRKKVIIDVTGIRLTPGNNGRDCAGNGEHRDKFGNIIECCCDECDYLLCCTEDNLLYSCMSCGNKECPSFFKKK